jgi:prepilin signal peptidase PulO-like enzyme (type II secretory pathway)
MIQTHNYEFRYANAGLPGTFYSDKVQSYLSANLWLFVFRVSLGLIGSLLLWTGIYNIIDAYTVESSLYKDLVTLFVGFIGLALSGTFYGTYIMTCDKCSHAA